MLGIYSIKLSVLVSDEARCSGLLSSFILLELNFEEIFIIFSSLVDIRMVSTFSIFRRVSILICIRPPSIFEKGFVFFSLIRSLPFLQGRKIVFFS